MPAAVRRAWTAIGDGATETPPDHSREVAGAALRVRHLHAGGGARGLEALLHRRVRYRQRDTGGRRGLAGDADHRHEVGTVGLDLDVQDDVVEPEQLLHVPADRKAGRQDEDRAVVARDRQLARGAHHSLRLLAAQPLDAERVRQGGHPRAGRRVADEVAGLPVRDAGGHMRLAPSGVERRQRQLVRVGVGALVQDAGHDDARQPVPRAQEVLHVDALLAQPVREHLGREVGGAVLAQPRQGNPHRTPSNRRRNRTSPSHSIRMSGMPNRAMASRS